MSRRALFTAGLCLFALALSSRASAQELAPPTISNQPPTTRNFEQKHPYWQSWPTRPFIAAVFDAGVFFIRPTIELGYGRPHWKWIGVEGYSSLSLTSAAEYGGVRAALPWLDLRAGVRYSASLLYNFLPDQDTYTLDQAESSVGPRARYIAEENEAAIGIPTPFGSAFAVATGYALFGVPSGYDVFEDTLHVIVRAPFIWRARVGFFVKASRDGALRVGLAAETINVPQREDLWVVRAGPLASLQLTYHLDAMASFVPVIASRDSLGLIGADFGQVGLRYRWATGDLFRDFP